MTHRIFAFVALSAVAVACGPDRVPSGERRAPLATTAVATGGADPTGGGRRTKFLTAPDEFVFVIGGEPETIDPGKARGVNESKIVTNLFEGLTEYPLGVGDMQPGAAVNWEVSADGLTYTFHLRPDGRWSNGDPVTAEDFRYSWLRVLDKSNGSPYADMLFTIRGAEDYYEGRLRDPDAVGVKVIDPLTLEVKLEYVAPYFLELAAFYTYRPVHRATVEAHGDRWTRPENIVTNGPYVLDEWSPNQHLKAKVNPHYPDADKLGIRRFSALVVQENTTMVNVYEGGKLDWTGSLDLPAIQINTLSLRADYREDPYLGIYFYRLNVTHRFLSDARVRRALSYAVDREAIVKVIKMGISVSETYVPPMPGYTPGEGGVGFDPEAGRRLLAEAGYPDAASLPRLQLLYNTQENHKRIAEMIQQMWRRHLGLKVDLVNQEWKVYLKSQEALDYDVSRSGWIGDYLDPMTFLGMWTEGNGNNNTGWADKEFEGLLEKARHEGDPRARSALLTRAESILLQRGPVLPIYSYARAYLLNPAVQGFAPHPTDEHPIRYMRKTRPEAAP
ncbi:MAG: peptide ABC transporter substrate-binding protein [Myxococcales bacterium]|nr:peptide ABC transporter substrate-binding protein [Myxococcales bacterium]